MKNIWTLLTIVYRSLGIILILGVTINSCKEKPDYQDEFQERILIQLLIEPQPAPLANCQDYFQSMGNCLSQAVNPDGATESFALARVFYFATQGEVSSGSNLAEVCGDIINGRFFSRFSDKAKDCYLKCQRGLWKELEDNNQCTNEYSNLFTTNLESSRARTCLQRCGQVNNTSEF
ncbi:MAG: hypothetical protein JJT78_14685 [Leptospira sp.]|nr:hypothetical protein [Leptospira sp.]